MKLRNILLGITLVALSTSSFAQQRLSLDLSTRAHNLQGTFTYHKVVKEKFILSGGITHGSHDKLYRDYHTEGISLPVFRTPFANLNEDIQFTDSVFQLAQYTNKTELIGLNLSLGFFHEFNVTHGFRTHINFIGGVGYNRFTLNYYDESRDLIYKTLQNERIATVAIELQLFHTIRLNPRYTFYYGAKIPYFLDVDKDFAPSSNKDTFIGFEPQLTLGISRSIGNCD